MADLPDYFTWVEAIYVLASSLRHGVDADRPVAPLTGEVWLSTDTNVFWICNPDGVWVDFPISDLATHILATTGIHGVGVSTIASLAEVVAAVAAHAALTATHGVSGTIADVSDAIKYAIALGN